MNCESVHFLGWPTVRRSHLPRHEGAASALQRVFLPGKPSPRQRNVGESSWIDELSVISSGSASFCNASRSHRTTTRSPESRKTNTWWILYEQINRLLNVYFDQKKRKNWITFSQLIVWWKLMTCFCCFYYFELDTVPKIRDGNFRWNNVAKKIFLLKLKQCW